MHQVDKIAVAILEEDEAVALVVNGLAEKSYTFVLEVGLRRVEIVDQDGEVANAGIFHFLLGARAFGWDDFEHAAVLGLDEVVSRVGVIDDEIEMIDIPLGQLLRIRGSDRSVFQSFEHK